MQEATSEYDLLHKALYGTYQLKNRAIFVMSY